MSLKGKRVLVTGAGGFIGSHLVERLVQEGADTRALVRYNSSGRRGWLDSSPVAGEVEFTAGDVTDADLVSGIVADREIVFHLAALIGIPYSYSAPTSYLRTNTEGTLNVLKAAGHHEAKVIHTSTSEAYGTARTVPISEDHPLQGQSPYSASKIAADKMAEAYHLSFGLDVVTVRPFNTFGPRQSARAVIPTIIVQSLSGVSSLKLGNTSPTRDFTFVSDTVEGFVKAAESNQATGRVVNLGTGTEISIKNLALKIGSLLGSNLKIEEDPRRVRVIGSEVERLCSNNAVAQELLNWKPKVTLEDGLKRTIEWIRENLDKYRPTTYTI